MMNIVKTMTRVGGACAAWLVLAGIAGAQDATWMASMPVDQLVTMGYDNLDAGRFDNALQYFMFAAKQDHGNETALMGLATTLYWRDDLERAARTADILVAKNGTNVTALILRGAVYWRAKETAQAVAFFKQACALDPANAVAHNNLAVALQAENQPDQAIAAAKTAVAKAPGYADAQYNLAVLLATAPDPELRQARRAYDRARDLGHAPSPGLENLLNR